MDSAGSPTLDMAINHEFPEGVRGNRRAHREWSGLKLISDEGCQPLSPSFRKDMAILGIE